MAGFRRPEIPREQMVLWSQRLDDAIPLDHPVRHLEYLLGAEAFAGTFREWEQQYVLLEGKPPYHPRDLAGLYLYGMLNRIRSSRQLEQACYNRVDMIWLMSGQHPDHATIAGFVKAHGDRLRRQTVEPRFGFMKRGLGIRRFLRRGLASVQAEWTLIRTAVNVGIVLRHWSEVVKVL